MPSHTEPTSTRGIPVCQTLAFVCSMVWRGRERGARQGRRSQCSNGNGKIDKNMTVGAVLLLRPLLLPFPPAAAARGIVCFHSIPHLFPAFAAAAPCFWQGEPFLRVGVRFPAHLSHRYSLTKTRSQTGRQTRHPSDLINFLGTLKKGGKEGEREGLPEPATSFPLSHLSSLILALVDSILLPLFSLSHFFLPLAALYGGRSDSILPLSSLVHQLLLRCSSLSFCLLVCSSPATASFCLTPAHLTHSLSLFRSQLQK